MPTTWTLEDLYRGIARGWKALAIIVVVCLLLAYAAFRVFPERYAATAVHTVEPISVLSDGSSFSTVNMDTEQIVASSTGVLQAAAETLGDGTTVRDLADATELEVPRGSQVLRFVVTTSRPSTSAAWANAIAMAYGTQRANAARTVVEQTSDELQQTIDELRERLDGQPAGSDAAEATELQLEALVAEQARLLATPFYSGSLITPAVEPTDSERPSILVFAAGGLFLGLLLGAFAALLWSGHTAKRDLTALDPGAARAPTRHARSTARRSSPRVPAAPKPADSTTQPESVRVRLVGVKPVASSGGQSQAQPGHTSQPGVQAGRGLPAQRRLQSNRR